MVPPDYGHPNYDNNNTPHNGTGGQREVKSNYITNDEGPNHSDKDECSAEDDGLHPVANSSNIHRSVIRTAPTDKKTVNARPAKTDTSQTDGPHATGQGSNPKTEDAATTSSPPSTQGPDL